MFSLKNKTIAITGGSGGIGSMLVQRFIEMGARVIVIDRVEKTDFAATCIKGDLSSLEGITKISQELQNHQIDILINLAGIQYFGIFEEQLPENITLTYFVNLIAPVLLTQAVLPQMKKNNSGHVVNIGSIFASINFAHFVTYSSSKSGLKAFSEALRRELNGSNIHVTYIAPRAVKTPLNNAKVLQLAAQTKMKMDAPELVVERIINSITQKKKDVYIGFPESLFVRVNSLFPRVVDGALANSDAIARTIVSN